jgi:UDP-hydrolysing UDP-N-acetyl-D-glucosamine 2-epimerase
MHLSEHYGMTVRLIEEDGFRVDARVEMLPENDTPLAVARATGVGTTRIAEVLDDLEPDLVVILGDRFEALAAATAAFLMRIPVAHVHGGEITLGALDDGLRHAITKMSLLHFASTEEYAQRIVQMGEKPANVFMVGALGIDNVRSIVTLDRSTLEAEIGIPAAANIILATYHPVTLGEDGGSAREFAELLAALEDTDRFVVFTRPNADAGNAAINRMLDEWVAARPDARAAFSALGHQRYLSLASSADLVIGNSSSGIIEVPALGTPVVDIGSRQAGRVVPVAVVHSEPDRASIQHAIETAMSPAHRAAISSSANPYGDGHAAERIVQVLREADISRAALRKGFHDLRQEHA